MTDPKEMIELLASNAARLRAAGVTHLRIGDFEATLAPDEPELGEVGETDPEMMYSGDPLEDPATFGGPVPTFKRDNQ